MQHTSLVFIVHRGQNKCLSNSSFVSFTTKFFMSARTRCVSVMRMLVITHLFVSTHSSVMTIVKSRPFREKQGKILLEGRRLIADALKAGAVPKVFFFSRLEYIKELPIEKLKGVSLIKVKFEDIKDWSDLVTPQGIMGQWLFTVSVEGEAWDHLFILVSGQQI